jgi:lipopolysaccharide export LptBFGC system permease protein LptF
LNKPKKLDLYIASGFLGPFAVCLLGFAGLFVVADFFSNIDEFFDDQSLLDNLGLVALYYLARLPSYLAQIIPVLTVLPAVVAIIRLDRSNELVAIRAAGLSSRRITAPLLACGVAITVLAALNQEVLVPSLRITLADLERDTRGAGKKRTSLSHVVDRNNRLILISTYDPQQPLPTLVNVAFTWKDDLGVGHEKRAARAFTLPDSLGPTWYMSRVQHYDGRLTLLKGKVWTDGEPERFTSPAVRELLKDYVTSTQLDQRALMTVEQKPPHRRFEIGSFDPNNETWPVAYGVEIIQPEVSGEDRLHIDMMVWVDDRWLVFGARRFLGIDPETRRVREESVANGSVLTGSIHPSEIRRGDFDHISTSLTLAELADMGERFRSERFRQRCWVVIWNRIAYPLANILLILLSVPLIIRRSGQGALMGLVLALVMTLCFMACNFISLDLAYRRWFLWQIPAFAGLFPTVLFALIALWWFRKMDEV